MQERSNPPIALIAGNGQFPLAFIEAARMKGRSVWAVCHTGETDPRVAELAEGHIWVKVGQLKKILSFIKHSKALEVVFTGGISRVKLFKNASFDLKTLALIARIGSIKDDAILRGIAAEIEKIGVNVVASGGILDHCVVKKGLLTKRSLTDLERENARIGWHAAKQLGLLDVGQTAITAGGLVVALECVEGTDEAIRRGGALCGSRNTVVVKVAKPNQDLRLDLPSLGDQTIAVMKESRATALIIEHERAMMLDPSLFIKAANDANIAVQVVSDESELA